MTIGTDKDGNTVITLSQEESRVFPHCVPIYRQTDTRVGIVEVEVRKRISCPNGHTLAFLRDLYRDQQAKNGTCDLTVAQVVPLLRSDQGMIEADLRKFAQRVDPDVEIAELIGLKTIPSAADTVNKFRAIYDAIERWNNDKDNDAPRPRLIVQGQTLLITEATLVGGVRIRVTTRTPISRETSERDLAAGDVVLIGDEKLTI